MTKIYCGAVECVYNSDKNICKAKLIKLNDCYYNTVNEGYKHFNKCKMFMESERAKEIKKISDEAVKRENDRKRSNPDVGENT